VLWNTHETLLIFKVTSGPNVGLPISNTSGPNVSFKVTSNLHRLGLAI